MATLIGFLTSHSRLRVNETHAPKVRTIHNWMNRNYEIVSECLVSPTGHRTRSDRTEPFHRITELAKPNKSLSRFNRCPNKASFLPLLLILKFNARAECYP